MRCPRSGEWPHTHADTDSLTGPSVGGTAAGCRAGYGRGGQCWRTQSKYIMFIYEMLKELFKMLKKALPFK